MHPSKAPLLKSSLGGCTRAISHLLLFSAACLILRASRRDCRWKTPKLVPGLPKQFAALCGLSFSLLATILFHVLDSGTAGAVVLGMLMGAAALEVCNMKCSV